MKSIVIYYSLEGNTKYVAETIAQRIGADILRLEPQKSYATGKFSKFFWGGKSVIFGEQPVLKEYAISLSDYDLVVLGTPVWSGSFAPPLKTFIHENNLAGKRIALFACNSGGEANSCFDKIKQELNMETVVSQLTLCEPIVKKVADNDRKIEEFCKELLNSMQEFVGEV